MSSDREPLRKAGDADVHPSEVRVPDIQLGGTTSDYIALRKMKDKQVKLEVRVPKSLRTAARREAEARGVSVDEVIADSLRSRYLS